MPRQPLNIRFSDEELIELQRAADAARLPLTTWIRQQALLAANKEEGHDDQ